MGEPDPEAEKYQCGWTVLEGDREEGLDNIASCDLRLRVRIKSKVQWKQLKSFKQGSDVSLVVILKYFSEKFHTCKEIYKHSYHPALFKHCYKIHIFVYN